MMRVKFSQQCGKVIKNTITVFTEKSTLFYQINGFTKEVIKELISQKIFERDRGARIIELFHPKKNREIK